MLDTHPETGIILTSLGIARFCFPHIQSNSNWANCPVLPYAEIARCLDHIEVEQGNLRLSRRFTTEG